MTNATPPFGPPPPPVPPTQVPKSKVAPETLALKTKPQPVVSINRTTLIGVAAIVLIGIAGLVLVALQPVSIRGSDQTQPVIVDRKAMADGLDGLPRTYDGVMVAPTASPDPLRSKGVTQLKTPPADGSTDEEKAERARLAKLASQAHEAPVLFRLQAVTTPQGQGAWQPRAATPLLASPVSTDPGFATLTALKAVERVQAATGPESGSKIADATEPTRKLAFLKSTPDKDIYNPHGLQTPVSPYQLMAGAILAASLVSGLSSDLPGFVIAQVTENVYDSVTGRFLLIPQGSRLIGTYDNVVAFGQERALVVWQRIILPDGASVQIDNLPATDTGGYTGLADTVDLHTWKLLKGIALSTVLGVGSNVAFGPAATGANGDILKALQESAGQTTNRAGQRLVEKTLNVQPTFTIRPGWPLRIIVHKDIVLRPYRLPSPN